MKLSLNEWKPFRVGKLFVMLNGKGITQEEIQDNPGNFNAVQSGEDNNGVIGKIDLNYCKEMDYVFSVKPCLTVARTGTAGFVSFQEHGCVVGDSAKILLLPDDVASREVYLFLQTILSVNRSKYTYGRKVTRDKYLNDWIDLPIQHDADGAPFFDDNRRFSPEGYRPDWRFMDDYIRSLNCKPLTTKNSSATRINVLRINEWKEFHLYELFTDIKNCTSHDIGNLDDGNVAFVGRTASNNGLQGFVDVPEDEINDGNCISLSRVASNVALWQPNPFTTSQHITSLRSKELNIYNGLFICTVMNKYMDGRFSYGRTIGEKDIRDFVVKLPTTIDGEPDWLFMEDYIKALPYGDRL